MRTGPLLRLAAVLAFLLVACGEGAGTRQVVEPDPTDVPSTVSAGPSGDAFYEPGPPPPDAEPGQLIWARRIVALPGMDGFAILYWSSDVEDRLVPVSGVLYRESGAPPTSPILAWAPGTLGLGRTCAASISRYGTRPVDLTLESAVTDLGLVFVTTDYQGLGTEDPHPYMVNVAAARNVLDSIRAAAELMGAGVRPQAVLVGESQGAAATLVAAELHPVYAPDLVIRGAVAAAPPSQLRALDEALDGGEFFGYVVMTVHGYEVAYPELASLRQHLTAPGQEALEWVGTQCVDAILDRFAGDTGSVYGVDAVVGSDAFEARLRENEPARHRTGVPILLVHGEEDETIPVEHTRELLEEYCQQGARVSITLVPDGGHLVLRLALDEVESFVRQRLAGTVAPTTCP